MIQNITMSAEKDLIERARQKAESKKTTLNAEFRRWLFQYVDSVDSEEELASLMERLSYARPGKKFSREDLNER